MRKDEDFSEWYQEVIEQAGLRDKRYPLKGCDVWTPYGWKVMSLFDRHTREELDCHGHEEVLFPTLIPETEFQKEAKHIKGFSSGVYWVTRGGLSPLEIDLLLRPTSETSMYPIFALWVRSHADLPLKVYQIASTFRYETKQTRTFIRMREIHFFEAHTCHRDSEDAESQVKEDLAIMERLSKKLAVAYYAHRRPEWDKFAGAHYSIGIDAFTPAGRALQIASIHHYKDNFAKAFEIQYEEEGGERKYVHQTTYGMSERVLGSVVAIHGDDQGILLPPEIAPIQVVIIPVLEKGQKEEVTAEARRIFEMLRPTYRTHLDDRDIRPGQKYFDWERKGVPLRLELGPKELTAPTITGARRDAKGRFSLAKETLVQEVGRILDQIQADLFQRSLRFLSENTRRVSSLDQLGEGLLEMGWCGEEPCGLRIEEATGGNVLGTPVDPVPFEGPCIVCAKPTKTLVRAAKTF